MTEAASPITLSASAARRIAELVAMDEHTGMKFRVSVSGGGCSGFQYGFGFDDKTEADELVVERDGAKMVIDSMSLMYLAGSEVDFIENVGGSYFVINNPNATSSCGCGSSFGISM
ncbi:MAG: iron-sulfur cluster insertion protein ErpA [Proteobacteria bacterium]|nr:iron-sulfur cluster insertion protein ErpA [Pseudomonadota bacterium]